MIEGYVDQRPLLRVALTAVVIVDLVSFYFFVGDARAGALANGLTIGAVTDLLSQPAIIGAMILAGVAGAGAFAAKPGRLWCGMLPLAVLMLLSTVHAQLFGSPWRHLYYSGLCLAGWLIGLAVSRGRTTRTDESFARMGGLALLAAAYFNAGISKIAYGGIEWVSGLPVQAAVIAQDGLVADSFLSAYRSWVVTAPAAAVLFSILTVAFELAGPLMIVGRGIRLFVVLGLVAMHVNLYVLTPILYWEAMALLVLFGLSAERWDAEAELQPTSPMLAHDRTFAVAASLLTICAIAVIGHQAVRFSRSRDPQTALPQPPESHPTAGAPPAVGAPAAVPPSALRQVGPLVVGQALADTWLINGLTVADEAVVVTLAGEPGHVRFEVTCRSEHRSPFDLGEAYILYSQHTEFRLLESAGWALQRRLREAAAGGDICDKLAEWRRSAR